MNLVNIKLVKKEPVAEGTFSFYFSKPSAFSFKPGQYVEMVLDEMPYQDEKGNRRYFSIASAPHEDYLMFAMRMRESAFKKSLRELSLGKEVRISLPLGSFTLHDDVKKPAIFLAGGIGVTPFRSMIHDVIKRSLPYPVYFFYANRDISSAAFFNDLEIMKKKHQNFHFIPVFSQESNANSKHERGRININLIKKYTGDIDNAIFYISGTPGMVSGLSKHLEENNVLSQNIKTDAFSGY